jgi:magnesium transporter
MLMNCVAYRDGRKIADIAPEAISEYVGQPDCLVWVALRDPEPAELELMQEEFALHPLAVEDARHGHQRPKIEEYGESLFVVLHTLELVAPGEVQKGEVDVFVGPNYVLSCRTGTREGFGAVRARCEREPELLRHGAGFVLYALLDAVVDRYFPVLDDLDGELDRMEERILAGAPARGTVEALYDIKARLMTVQHAVRPLVEAVGKLHGGRVPAICAGLPDYFRDVSDHLQRLGASIDSLREMATTAMSVTLSLTAVQQNETMKKLAGYAALIAVPTLIAGVYGMNFQHMPELSWRLGYPASLGLMAAADLGLFWYFRRTGWM